jgi:signal transduction histidine kinase/DNA-binding NarL/FixJ family response regulator
MGLWLACACAAWGAQAPPLAAAGTLILAAPVAEPVLLQGQWGFAWQRFVDPAWTRLPTAVFAPVPSSWNALRAEGKPAGPDGFGSYVLQVDCPAGQALAVEAFGQRTASRLFVNGMAVAAHGHPGASDAATHAAVHTRIPISREFACPLRITLHVANFDHRAGGFVRPLLVGPADVLARAREARIVHHAALLSAYLLTGVVALISFAVRRREPIPLVFGLFCIAMALYTDMIGERLFLRLLPWPEFGWTPYMRVEYLSWLGAMALFLLTLRGLFPQEIRRRVVQVVLAMLGAAAIAVLALRPGVYSHVVLPGQALAVLVALYVAKAMLRAGSRSRADARVLLAGMLAVLATLALDLLLIDAPGPDRKFAPLGFALFMLSPAVVIARRMARALNAEERSRTLEENARLREDVERISRHDLKTPLSSIVGVTRLLRDDGRLSTDQRELVGVLQRAALRMLEMVNLSLGLYRMETGSYDFRPQSVDLREVANRVLVDLHSSAETGGVRLHLHSSQPTATYVRGEELLCYSIIANLVKNAIEATASGGQVTLTLQRGDPVRLLVHNPGAVPPEIASRFFEKYVTGRKSAGTGLGTYSARLMARAQQGELELHTGAAEGTTITLRLNPLKGELPQVRALPQTDVAPAHWVAGMPARDVLVVDDDEFMRLVTRRYLPTPPFNVDTAANGRDAMEAMGRRWPHFLLLDMEMPLQGGVETVRWVRQQEATAGRPRCAVVMLSANDDEASAARAREAGADRFLVKPVTRETLLATLRELESEALERPAGARRAAPALPTTAPAPLSSSSPEDEIVVVEPEWVAFFPDFVRLQGETVEAMARAVLAGDREDVAFLAHRASGGLATMGMAWAARQSRAIEKEAHNAPLEQLGRRVESLREHLRKVRVRAP